MTAPWPIPDWLRRFAWTGLSAMAGLVMCLMLIVCTARLCLPSPSVLSSSETELKIRDKANYFHWIEFAGYTYPISFFDRYTVIFYLNDFAPLPPEAVESIQFISDQSTITLRFFGEQLAGKPEIAQAARLYFPISRQAIITLAASPPFLIRILGKNQVLGEYRQGDNAPWRAACMAALN